MKEYFIYYIENDTKIYIAGLTDDNKMIFTTDIKSANTFYDIDQVELMIVTLEDDGLLEGHKLHIEELELKEKYFVIKNITIPITIKAYYHSGINVDEKFILSMWNGALFEKRTPIVNEIEPVQYHEVDTKIIVSNRGETRSSVIRYTDGYEK